MAVSRNDWDVYTSSSDPNLTPFPWVTGRVRSGDHYVVLDYVARRFNTEVEKIVIGHSWGWAYRAVRGYTTVVSEHATGTATDYNAPNHPIGVRNTFSILKRARIRKIVKDCRGAVRWGGEWARPDDMHFELIGGNAKIKEVADLIRAGKLPNSGSKHTIKPVAKDPKPIKPTKKPAGIKRPPQLIVGGKFGKPTVKSLQSLMALCGYMQGKLDGVPGPITWKAVQAWLHELGYYSRNIDGDPGYYTILALQQFLRAKGLYTKAYLLDGKLGKYTIKSLQKYLNSQRKFF